MQSFQRLSSTQCTASVWAVGTSWASAALDTEVFTFTPGSLSQFHLEFDPRLDILQWLQPTHTTLSHLPPEADTA